MDESTIKLKFPKSAPFLYYSLYCKRKKKYNNPSKNTLTEASHSWLTLSKEEKLKFFDKHKKYQRELMQNIAKGLQTVKPYLKKRTSDHVISSTERNALETGLNDNENDTTKEDLTLKTSDNHTIERDTVEANVLENETNSNIEENTPEAGENNTEVDVSSNREQTIQNYEICEPTPPCVINGRQLFNMLCNDSDSESSWAHLTVSQKRQYGRAILAIKKKYLKDYQTYLENLTSPKLISHYKTVMSTE